MTDSPIPTIEVHRDSHSALAHKHRDSRATQGSNRSSTSGNSNHEQTVKLCVLGAQRVGKTALVSQFLWNVFVEEYVPTTEECNWVEYEMPPPNDGKTFTLQIVDSCGRDDFPEMRRLYMQSSDAVVLVFSVIDNDSWEIAKDMFGEIQQRNEHQASVILVGNKTDMRDEREELYDVPITEISHFAAVHRIPYTLLSARDTLTVQHTFRQVLNAKLELSVCKKRRQSMPDPAAIKRGSSAFDPKDFERIRAAHELAEKQRKEKRCSIT